MIDDNSPDATQKLSATHFYGVLGVALVSWQDVEHQAFRLFHALSRCGDPRISGCLFCTPDSFGQRLRMIANLLKVAISEEEIAKEWDTLKKELDRAARHRNWMVHNPIAVDFSQENDIDFVFVPPMFKPSQIAKSTPEKFNTERLAALVDEFDLLAKRIEAFTERVSAAL